MTDDDVGAWLSANAIDTVRVESIAIDGWLFGKQTSTAKFLAGLGGIPTADYALGVDLDGTPMFGWWDEWRGELGDIVHVPDLDTLAASARPGTATVLADVHQLTGEPVPIDPRSALRRLVARLDDLGFTSKLAVELEAYVFAESLDEARSRDFADLTPLGGPTHLGYATDRPGALLDYMDAVVARVRGLGIEWEGWLCEYGAGQIEFNVAPADPLGTADSIMRVKSVMREVADELGRCVTFMSKPIVGYANGLHINHSLQREGSPAFLDADGVDGRSDTMRHWLGGLMASMPASMSFFAPCITSYRRLEIDGPPLNVTWGENNKTTAIRTVTRTPKVTRLEHRVPSGDANPYLAIAAVLAGGIRGLEDQLDPPPEFHGMAWGAPRSADVEPLPDTITRAAEALRRDERFGEIMGPELVRHWIETRRWEWLMFHTTGGDPDSFTGPWELHRYFERV